MGAERVTLEVVKSHCLGGGRNVEIGDVLTVPGDLKMEEAEAKVRLGYAVVVEDDQIPTTPTQEDDPNPEGETEKGSPGAIETGDPTVETRDPASPNPKPPTGKKGGGRRKGRG